MHLVKKLITALSLTVIAITAIADTSKPSAAAVQLIENFALREGKTASREHPRWNKPEQIVIAIPGAYQALAQPVLASLQPIAGDIPVKLYISKAGEAAPEYLKNAEVVLGSCSGALLEQLPELIWFQNFSSGSEACTATGGIKDADFILTNAQRLSSPAIAEHAIAMMMSLGRDLPLYQRNQLESKWQRSPSGAANREISGQTMLVLGLGGIGNEVAKRAHGLGMRVIATRNSSRTGPDYVAQVGLASEMNELAKQADVVVNALPFTASTENIVDEAFFTAMKKGSVYISVGRGKTTDQEALMRALNSKHLAAAGLDVTDPEPLPKDHPLWTTENVIITPHSAGASMAGIQRGFILYQENLRRYLQGEKLLNVVNIERGY
jgi:phosphoglycerate dehydrogenase-like enzyme